MKDQSNETSETNGVDGDATEPTESTAFPWPDERERRGLRMIRTGEVTSVIDANAADRWIDRVLRRAPRVHDEPRVHGEPRRRRDMVPGDVFRHMAPQADDRASFEMFLAMTEVEYTVVSEHGERNNDGNASFFGDLRPEAMFEFIRHDDVSAEQSATSSPAASRPGWKAVPPIANEVLWCQRWWWRPLGPPRVDPIVLSLAIGAEEVVVVISDLDGDGVVEVTTLTSHDWPGEWCPCLPPDGDARTAP
jgi:hypothetical protein